MANEQYTSPNMSRSEEIVQATIDGTEYNKPPQSRLETLLIELKEAVEAGGGESSDYATALSLTIDSSTYIVTARLLNKDGDTLGTAQTIDLPLESVVMSGYYNSYTQTIVLTLQNGSTIEFSVADLVSGLQSEITSTNKLNADLVDDTNATHKFVTASDKTTWNNKQNVLIVGTNLDDEPIENSENPITSGGVYNTVGNIDEALDSLIMSLEPKTITANGTYNPADDGVDGYSEVTVNVPNTYTAGDNGKVVSNQMLVSQTAYPTTITENDTYDTTNYNSITVNVSGGGGSSNGLTIEGLTELGEMFTNNSDITSVIIGSDFEYIGDGVFQGCSALTSVTISNSVTSIGDYAFSSCSSLSSITIPDSVTSIGDYAFSSCSSLSSITIPDSVTSIGDYAFQYCSSLSSITIPDSVTSISDGVFSSCTSLTSITIPSSVTSIGDETFEDCESLETVIFSSPSSIESIGSDAFSGQYEGTPNLTTITIPSSVTSIGANAFSFNLEILTFEPTTPPELDGELGISTTCVIRVPQGTLSDYTSASNYPDPSDYIYEEY